MENIFTVIINRGEGRGAAEMSAKGIGMTEQDAQAYVLKKLGRKYIEAVAEGEYTVTIVADINNK